LRLFNKMRILKVTRCFYPAFEYGGPISVMLTLARSLIKKGHHVTVCSSNLLNPKEKMSQKTVIRNVDGIQVIYLNSWFNYHWEAFAPEIFSFCRKKLRGFDLIHIYGYRDFLSTVVCYYAQKWEIPYVLEPIGMLIPCIRSYAKKKIYDLFFGKKLVKEAQVIIATSESEKEELLNQRINEGKIFFRRNGINLSEFDPLPSKGAFREQLGLSKTELLILYLGRIAKIKNLDLLIKAFADLDLPQSRLIIVGPDDRDGSLNEILRLRRALGLKERVTLIGPLYGKERIQALVDADVLVLPSQSENFGNVAAEAVACGTPVVVTERCGIAPYIKDQVGLVVKPDKDEIRKAIYRILTNKELYKRFRKNTSWVKKEFSWEEPIRQMEELYKGIIKG